MEVHAAPRERPRRSRRSPIYLPEDKAIPAKEVPASSSFTRPFVRDKKVLQREAVGGTGWLALPAYLLLLAIVSLWLAALGLGLRRLEQTAGERSAEVTSEPAAPRPARARVVTPA